MILKCHSFYYEMLQNKVNLLCRWYSMSLCQQKRKNPTPQKKNKQQTPKLKNGTQCRLGTVKQFNTVQWMTVSEQYQWSLGRGKRRRTTFSVRGIMTNLFRCLQVQSTSTFKSLNRTMRFASNSWVIGAFCDCYMKNQVLQVSKYVFKMGQHLRNY